MAIILLEESNNSWEFQDDFNQETVTIYAPNLETATERATTELNRTKTDADMTAEWLIKNSITNLDVNIIKTPLTPKELDVIILATISGDMQFPATACFVQQKLGAENAAAFDISAACSGFIYGLKIANGLISSGAAKNVMVIGAEILSRFTDYTDRNTCILFGDGAGAALLQPSDGTRGLLGTYWKSNGNLTHLLLAPGSGSANPPTHETVDAGLHYLKMAGREVFKHAVNSMANAALSALEITGLSGADIDLLISHQANDRIIRATAQKAKIPPEKVFVNIEKYGNTSAASIPIAMDEAIASGRLKTGDKCLIVAFGGGFTWGSAIIQF